jgi:MFS family permease
VIFLCLMTFSVNLMGPYFTPFMRNDLKWDYITYTCITGVALLAKIIFMPIWGRAADKYGTRKVLSLTGFLMPITPLFWIFSQNIWYIVAVQAYSGFVWAGFELSSSNFLFDATESRTRATQITYFNVLNGLACLAGSLLGGFLVQINTVFWSRYILVIIISCVVRYIVSFFYIPRLKEVREVKHISYRNLLLEILSVWNNSGIIYRLIVLRRRKAIRALRERKEDRDADRM